jgi:hypothetical protein
MRLFTYLIAFSFFSFASLNSSQAQIIVDEGDMPSAGNSYVRANASPLTDLDFEQTGEDQIWDYSSLESTGLTTTNCISITEAPFLYQFLFNNPLSPNYQATYAVAGEGIDFGFGFALEEFFQFNKVSTTAFSAVGFGATVNGVPVPSGTNPIDVIYSLPMTMNSNHVNYSEWNIEIPATGAYTLKQDRSYTVDGYGTLILPDGEYEVLKLTMNVDAVDSIYVNQFDFSFEIPRSSIEYQWIAKEEGLPVLQVNTLLGATTNIEYKTNDVPDNIEKNEKVEVKAFPNPSSDYLFVEGVELGAHYEIIDLQGRVIQEGRFNSNLDFINLKDMANGSYLLKVLPSTSSAISSIRFQKQ